MKKRILSVLCICFMICTIPLTVYGLEVPDLGKEGSISVTMEHQGKKIPGGSLTIFRVGDIKVENGADYSFVFTSEYEACGFSLDDLASAELAKHLADYAKAKGFAGTTNRINNDGSVTFSGLKPGLYLFVQNEAASGYYAANPFLVSLPGKNDDGYEYQVNASPKLELEPKPTTPPPSNLPQTGQIKWPVPVFAVLGLLMICCGIIFRRRDVR